MIQELIENPHEIGYHQKERLADHMVKTLANKGMTYMQAWEVLDGHVKIIEEAIKHLNHNAGIEMKDNQVRFVLPENPNINLL